MAAAEASPSDRPIKGNMVLLPISPPGGFTVRDLPQLTEAVDANFELLEEGRYAPTGVYRTRVKVDRPFPIDIELPEVTW